MVFKAHPDIYHELLQGLVLTDEHKKELMIKRGFSEKTIDELQFKSALPKNSDVINRLVQQRGLSNCLECSIIDKKYKPAYQFTNPEFIIIPYLDHNNHCYFFKSHKFGSLTNSNPVPYSMKVANLQTDDSTIILCESEFKAAGMWQLGWKAVGLAGIATFSGKWLPDLIRFLEKFRTFIILFDNAEQDDENSPAYKPNFKTRYAHYVYSYVMADRILTKIQGSTVKIATLPKSWNVDGKSDIDSAIASGKTREDFKIVLNNALYPAQYRDTMEVPDKYIGWVNRKIEALCSDKMVIKDNNCYYVINHKNIGGESVALSKEITNFVINPHGTYHHNGKIQRSVDLQSKYGDRSLRFFVSPNEMANASRFKELCLSRGDYLYKGNDKEFLMLIEQTFLDTDPSPIHFLDMIGRNEEFGLWIFDNVIIKDTGEEIEKEDGEFRDFDIGWKTNNISNNPLPFLHKEKFCSNEEILNHFCEAWGFEGVVACLYIIATIFSNEVFAKYGMFPFALIYGEKDSGKSTLSDAMMFLCGFVATDTAMNMSDTTTVAVNRKLAFYHSLPCRFDEYRSGEKKIDDKSSILRSIYNRQKASKGLKDAFGVREVEPKAAFIMIGEQKPTDPALQSRFIPLYLKRSSRTEESYAAVRWFYEHTNKISHLAYGIIKNYQEYKKTYMQNVEIFRKTLQGLSKIQEPRTQLHYALLMAALHAFDPQSIEKYKKALLEALTNNVQEIAKDSSLGTFWHTIQTMFTMGDEVHNFMAIEYNENKHGVIFFPGVYECFKRFKQMRGGTSGLQDENTLKKYLISQPYTLSDRVRRKIGDIDKSKIMNCVLIDVDSQYTPEVLKDIFKSITIYAHTIKD